MFVWKVPAVHGVQHVGKTQAAVVKARAMVPKYIGREAITHFNRIIGGIASINSKARDALWNYIFLGQADPDESLGNDYVQLILDLAAG